MATGDDKTASIKTTSYFWLGPSGLGLITAVKMFTAHFKVRRDLSDTCNKVVEKITNGVE